MNLLILTEGGRKIGMGHTTRSHALAQAVKIMDPRNKITSFITSDSSKLADFPAELNVKLMDWCRHYASLASIIRRADAILIDSYRASRSVLKTIWSWNRRVFFIDDYNRLNYPGGTVIVPAPYFNSKHYPKRKGLQYLGGKDFIILRKPFWKKRKIKINPSIKNILLTLGGTSPRPLVSEIAALVLKCGAKVHGIIPNIQKQKKLPNLNFSQNLSASEMKSIMAKSDVAISAGGQTLYELASCGVPTIGFELASNQKQNLDFLKKGHALLHAGKIANSNFSKILTSQIDRAANYGLRKSLSAAAYRLVTGEGALRLGKILWNARRRDDFELRRVQKTDCKILWKWRNHPKVRRSSIQQQWIPYDTHIKWFEKQLKSQDVCIQFAAANRKRLGVVRYQKENPENATIHINLSPGMTGKGLGTSLLIKSTALYFEKNRSIRQIRAEILSSNEISKRCFVSAGFVRRAKFIKNGRSLLIYNLRREDV